MTSRCAAYAPITSTPSTTPSTTPSNTGGRTGEGARTQDRPRGPRGDPRRPRPRGRTAPRGPRGDPRRPRPRGRTAPRRPQRRPPHTQPTAPTRQRRREVVDRCRARLVPHRRTRAAPLPGAAPRRPHRHATRRDRRTQVIRPQPRPLPAVGVTHTAERRRPPRRVRRQNPNQPPKRRARPRHTRRADPVATTPRTRRAAVRAGRLDVPQHHGRFLNPQIDQPALRPHRPTKPASPHPVPRLSRCPRYADVFVLCLVSGDVQLPIVPRDSPLFTWCWYIFGTWNERRRTRRGQCDSPVARVRQLHSEWQPSTSGSGARVPLDLALVVLPWVRGLGASSTAVQIP